MRVPELANLSIGICLILRFYCRSYSLRSAAITSSSQTDNLMLILTEHIEPGPRFTPCAYLTASSHWPCHSYGMSSGKYCRIAFYMTFHTPYQKSPDDTCWRISRQPGLLQYHLRRHDSISQRIGPSPSQCLTTIFELSFQRNGSLGPSAFYDAAHPITWLSSPIFKLPT